ncbi:MAG TPA: Os1348 family NHLP clan protein [Anaerolineae bacterium]|nr:Os1348 family NHLP clan protein [Anaerolineae bacterium]
MTQLERVLGKAILDSDFRQQLLANPQEATVGIRVKLTDAQAAAIQNLDPDLVEWWAEGFEVARGGAEGFLW